MVQQDDDNKYKKIEAQEARFRSRFGVFALLLIAFIGLHFISHKEEDKAYFAKVEERASSAANKWLHSSNQNAGSESDGSLRQTKTAQHQDSTHDTNDKPVVAAPEEATDSDGAQKRALTNQRKSHGDDAVSEEVLVKEVEKLDAKVRHIKSALPAGHFMETDPKALEATKNLQDATRKLLHKRYGVKEPYRVKLELEFQATIPDFEKDGGKHGTITLEMAPSSLQPHSIFTYMEVARLYKGGGFHRIAGHVLQVQVRTDPRVQHLAFQEYSPQFPHVKGSVGYAGRPSGPAWYVSIANNVKNHGPGSQQKANPHEADSCFGKVVEGFDTDVQRIRKVDGHEFISDHKKWVLIRKMQIMVPGEDAEYIDWVPSNHDITAEM